jgi:SPP1 family predicted phage head-tail adaptor
MEAGKLDRQITLQAATATGNAYGEDVTTWGDNLQVWANVRHQTAREVFLADQQQARQTLIFTIRYRAGITAGKHRVQYEGVTYDITGVMPIGRREGLQLIGEGTNNG